MRPAVALLALLMLPVAASAAEPSEPSSASTVGSVKDGSRALGDGAGSVGDASRGGVRSGPLRDISRPVRDGRGTGMLSGPVSELSGGPISGGHSVYGNGAIGAGSRGAVTQDGARPMHMERPVTAGELEQLEQDLRAIEPLPSE